MAGHPGIRAASVVLLTALVAVLNIARLDGRRLLYLERFTTPILTLLFAGPAVLAGGLSSIYGVLPILAIVYRSTMRADPWEQALPSIVATVLAYPATLAVAGAVSPRIAAQWSDPSAAATLAAYTLTAASVGFYTLWSGHTDSLHQQLYEARKIGRYKLITMLGKGAMGEVWAAHFRALKREVAIKILRLPDDMAVTRFEREVRATAELSHPNTVRVFDYGRTDDGLWYYAMERLEGESLRRSSTGRRRFRPRARSTSFYRRRARSRRRTSGASPPRPGFSTRAQSQAYSFCDFIMALMRGGP